MLDVMFHFRGSKAVQALPIKDEELILTPDIQSDIGAESDVAKRVSVIADLTSAVECQRLQVLDRVLLPTLVCAAIGLLRKS